MKLANASVAAMVNGSDVYDEIRTALQRALNETLTQMVSHETLEMLLGQLAQKAHVHSAPVRKTQPAAPCEVLTARELEILNHIAAGSSNKAIARALGLSLHTVKRHVANILGKLGVASRVQAATWLSARH